MFDSLFLFKVVLQSPQSIVKLLLGQIFTPRPWRIGSKMECLACSRLAVSTMQCNVTNCCRWDTYIMGMHRICRTNPTCEDGWEECWEWHSRAIQARFIYYSRSLEAACIQLAGMDYGLSQRDDSRETSKDFASFFRKRGLPCQVLPDPLAQVGGSGSETWRGRMYFGTFGDATSTQ